jgi:hypothetical protein
MELLRNRSLRTLLGEHLGNWVETVLLIHIVCIFCSSFSTCGVRWWWKWFLQSLFTYTEYSSSKNYNTCYSLIIFHAHHHASYGTRTDFVFGPSGVFSVIVSMGNSSNSDLCSGQNKRYGCIW